jgi:hypothetical protein
MYVDALLDPVGTTHMGRNIILVERHRGVAVVSLAFIVGQILILGLLG